MQIIEIDSITVLPNRQRREFPPEKMLQLQSSIGKVGLQNPIVVRANGTSWILVSGERRLRAIRDMHDFGEEVLYEGTTVHPGFVPATTDAELSPLQAKKAELEENLRRENLTWEEETAAIAEVAQTEAQLAKVAGQPAPSNEQLAEDYLPPKRGGYEGTSQAEAVRQRVILAPHLGDPDIAKAGSVKEAFAILKRKAADAKHAELARTVGPRFSAKDHTLLQGDALGIMAGLAPESFDVILCDPPYGIDAQDFGDADGRLVEQTHKYEDSHGSWSDLMSAFAMEAFRVAKPQAHAYICCDFDRFHELKKYMMGAGWYVTRTPLINFKLDGSRVPLPEHGPQRKWEMVLYAIKGWRKVLRIYSDIISTRGDDNLGHGAQKPVALYSDLLRRSVRPGDTVLDPFCGTGTVFPAAHAALCAATGIELDQTYAGIAAKRLGELK